MKYISLQRVKIIDEGKPEERIKEVEKAPLIKSKNPPLIHLTDEERLFIQNQLEMFRKEKNHTDTTQQTNEIDALSTNVFVTDIYIYNNTNWDNEHYSNRLFTDVHRTPQTTILDTPATNTFPTFPDFTELIETPIATVTTNTVPIYDMALHTTVLNETKTNTSTAYMDLTQLANSPDTTTTTTTSKSVPIYDMTQKSTTLDTTCMTANTFSTFTDITLQTNALEAPTQNTLTANMTQQTMRLDATTDPNFLQTSNHLPQQTVTHTGCTTTNTTELHVPQDWTDTTLTTCHLISFPKKLMG